MPRALIQDIGAGPVQRVRLEVQGAFDFAAGQYTAVVHPNGTPIPFSIASSPHLLPHLELHFQPLPGAPEAELMQSVLRTQTHLTLSPPAGNVSLTRSDEDVFFVCGGSGAAQAWCMLSWLASQPRAPAATMLWCVDHADHLYIESELRALPFLDLHVRVDDSRDAENAGLAWLRENAPPLKQRSTFLCGGPGFVWSAADALEGFRLSSDVFDFFPRGAG